MKTDIIIFECRLPCGLIQPMKADRAHGIQVMLGVFIR